ncbi:MAG: diguanylate cyclase [Planctomycetaceae bacterium]|nr:diguanylate cyclase [Planctomycetaceae bacterium]
MDSVTADLLRHTLNSLKSHIAVLDQGGTILFTNQAWRAFALKNDLSPDSCGAGTNYLQACQDALGEEARAAVHGIRAVISGAEPDFYLEYPCHSPTDQRWFSMRVTRFEINGSIGIVVAHDNITQRKQSEIALQVAKDRLEVLSHTDELTGVANRRSFGATLDTEWKRHQRASLPLSLALIDADFFKKFNDSCGHVQGDECLRSLAQAIQRGIRRPGDLAARYGGEEFGVILPNTPQTGARQVAENIREQVGDLGIVHPSSPISAHVTISIGVATVVPTRSGSANDLINLADKALYQAKSLGRNQTSFGDSE